MVVMVMVMMVVMVMVTCERLAYKTAVMWRW